MRRVTKDSTYSFEEMGDHLKSNEIWESFEIVMSYQSKLEHSYSEVYHIDNHYDEDWSKFDISQQFDQTTTCKFVSNMLCENDQSDVKTDGLNTYS